MPNRIRILVVGFMLVLAWGTPTEAQKFKLGGGAGFAFPHDPELSLQRGFDVGGFIGIRFNDNFSIETGFSYSKFDRQFAEDYRPIAERAGELASFDFKSTQYHLDAVLVYHLGRRQPFQMFIFGGGGLMREDRSTIDLRPLYTAEDPTTVVLETTKSTDNRPVAAVGTGFDFYVLVNVAARGEIRMWLPADIDHRTWRLFFGATLFF